MKKIAVLIACIFIVSFSYAQSPLPKGKAQLNVGLGFSNWGVPFYVGLDYSVHKDVTLGGEFSYRSYLERYRKDFYYRHGITGFSFNGNYHFNTVLKIPREFDFYAGLNIGFYAWSSPRDYPGTYTSGLGLGAQIGGRYYFSKKAGINLEIGGGNAFSNGKFGLTIKL
jgi:outer membrane immunogenic protein